MGSLLMQEERGFFFVSGACCAFVTAGNRECGDLPPRVENPPSLSGRSVFHPLMLTSCALVLLFLLLCSHSDCGYIDSVLFLLISMTLIAAILYLPHHITLLAGRAWYYIQGDHINIAVSTSEAIKAVSATVAEVLPTGETVKEAVARTLEKEL